MSNLAERRRTTRSKVMLCAALEHSGKQGLSRIANVSSDGALVLGGALPLGMSVTLRRGSVDLPGRVAWVKGQQFGVRFDEPVEPGAMLRTIAAPRRHTVPANRRPGIKCRPLSQAERTLLERWATEGTTTLGS